MKDMSEIVCVAPDGSLEVWRKSRTISDRPFWLVGFDEYFWDTVPWFVPEFWGREVLGPL